MADGKVKWFDNKKGYGFIEQDNGPDVFMHYSDITPDAKRNIKQGDTVQFDLSRGDIGPKAANVKTVLV